MAGEKETYFKSLRTDENQVLTTEKDHQHAMTAA